MYVAARPGVTTWPFDAFSRRIVAWHADTTMKTSLLDTLDMALWAREHHDRLPRLVPIDPLQDRKLDLVDCLPGSSRWISSVS